MPRQVYYICVRSSSWYIAKGGCVWSQPKAKNYLVVTVKMAGCVKGKHFESYVTCRTLVSKTGEGSRWFLELTQSSLGTIAIHRSSEHWVYRLERMQSWALTKTWNCIRERKRAQILSIMGATCCQQECLMKSLVIYHIQTHGNSHSSNLGRNTVWLDPLMVRIKCFKPCNCTVCSSEGSGNVHFP